MQRLISNCQLVLIFTYVIFIAHTLAEPPEEVKNELLALRQRRRESIAENTNGNPRSRRFRGVDEDGSLELENSTPANLPDDTWGGAVQVSPPSGTFNYVSARWTIPTASRPTSANGSGEWYSSEWVGIDGYSCGNGLLQAGTDTFVTVSSNGSVAGAAAWYEWYPLGTVYYSNFPVAPGDTVEFSVTATSKSRGIVLVNNLSTGNSNKTSIDAPDNSTVLCGGTAEWIVEDFTVGAYPFSNFTNIYFENCTATTTTGATVNLTNATLIDVVEDNTVLATAVAINSTVLEVYYS